MLRRLVRASRSDSSGQTLILVAILLPLLLGVLGLAIDTGNLYVAQRHLQTATDAAALAAAQDLPDGTRALSDACAFSATPAGGSCPSGVALTDGRNVSGQLDDVSTSAQLECLSVATAGAGCVTGSGCRPPGCNAIKITQTGTVKTYLLGLLGIVDTKVTTSSTASMGGGPSPPLDVEVVLDSNTSMRDFDNCGAPTGTSGVTGIPYDPNGNPPTPSAEDCAKAGMRALLETLYPCKQDGSTSLTSCGPAARNNYAQPEDEVGLMSIPPLGGNPNPPSGHPAYVPPGNGLGIPAETNCIQDLTGGGYFRLPNGSDVTTSNYDPSNLPQYQFVPLSSDYKLSNASAPLDDSLLNPGSNLVKAVYWGKCPGGVYPVNGGSQGSSLSTPGPGDSSTANNDSSAPLTGGPNTAGSSTKATDGGAAAIGGFPSSGSSTALGVTSSSITISRPGTPAAGDYVVVAVTAVGSGASGTHICKPDSSWTELSQASSGTGSSRITQAVFGSVRSSAGGESFTFSVVSGPTNESACSGSPVSLDLSAVAARYTGVDPYDPLDAGGTVRTGSGRRVTPPTVTSTYPDERVVELYSAAGSTLTNLTAGRSVSQGTGSSPPDGVTGLVDTDQASAGPSTPVQGTSSGRNWVASTIALKPMQGSSSIRVTRPAGAANDYVLVSVTATGLPSGLFGSSGSLSVCPPSGGGWTTISEKTQGSGGTAVTQAVFGSLRTSASDPDYTFSFVDGSSCSSSSPASVEASAVATRYTGIDAANPVEVSATGAGTDGTVLTAPTTPTTDHANDQIVRVYSDASSTIALGQANGVQQQAGQSQSSAGDSNVTVVTDTAQAARSAPGTATATTVARHNWIAETIALEPQQGKTTITIDRPSTSAGGDLLIVSVTVQGRVSICAPKTAPFWTDVGTGPVSSGTGANDVTTQAFFSYRNSADPPGQSYTFSIVDGSCEGGGTPVARPATAVAVRYSGANPVAPIEVAGSKTGSSPTPTTSPVTTGNINDAILSLYGSSATSFSSGVSESASGADTASAFQSTVQSAPGTTSPQSATTSADQPWVALTIAIAAADGGCSGHCAYGLEDPGGAATYYANAITAAKEALDAAAPSRPEARKVVILLSDGVGNVYSATPCQDAIKNAIAAETATATSTAATIYTIAYGNSGVRCSDSLPSTSLGTNVPMTGACAMRLIADNPTTDTTHGLAGGSMADAQAALCSGTIATDASEHFYLAPSGSDLASVFREIGQTLASPRLVSGSAT